MPPLPVSTVVHCADALVRGAVQVLGLTLVVAAFLPVAPALIFWPLMPAGKLFRLLELYKGWAVTIITWGGPAVDPAEGEPA
ncbi:hypothetical protein [Actinoallomurus rhizosphaericola]|uniref:hypothetical protein n=1 Tax=Actinoallomurus rhizosphaericola TaxID=2952536 RepID=UPI002092CA65|nr:hypothetical protein [Actinoallomurus rhizosphaericola]MCO5999792.1 hypothetical protein [Actinoallomurus rhizosphaericola]